MSTVSQVLAVMVIGAYGMPQHLPPLLITVFAPPLPLPLVAVG